MNRFKYISKLKINDLEFATVIPCINENGEHSILIRNKNMKSISTTYTTDNLIVKLDKVLHLEGLQFYCHVITSTKRDDYSIDQFHTIYEYIFKKIDSPVTSSEILTLINSIEEYFKITPDSDLKNLQVGVFGELLTIKYLYDVGYNEIVSKYHNDFYSKHDVEIDSKNRIEIKTTSSEKRVHRFKHNQIYRNDIDVYVASVMLEQSKEGYSLYKLFNDILDLYESMPDSILSLRKLMKRCNCSEENEGLMFSLEKAYNDLRLYDARMLPRLEIDVPNGVTGIEYDVDCSLVKDLVITEFIKKVNR